MKPNTKEPFVHEIILAGNPNVGKSTVFNALTGLKQHTGNWTGKTVSCASGSTEIDGEAYKVTDLPGTYSLFASSAEERVAAAYLEQHPQSCTILIVDSNALERNLSYVLEVLAIVKKAVLCLNLSDEAERNGIVIDENKLSEQLGIPVVKTCATKKKGLEQLKQTVAGVCDRQITCSIPPGLYADWSIAGEKPEPLPQLLAKKSKSLCDSCVTKSKAKTRRSEKLDKILTAKATGIPIMLALFALLFWITAVGANYPSELLSQFFAWIKEGLYRLFELLQAPPFLTGLLIDGVYTTLSWVVAVMFPPMAIFFPLFSLMEDSGYLPRIAFNLDTFFARCGAHGKQSLTMAMGIGCNACGVTGCRIIENRSERLIAVLTNNFMPCNGRFPILIALIMMYFSGSAFGLLASAEAALLLVGIILLCVLLTLGVSKVLSVTLFKGKPSGFALELPPYRKPQVGKTMIRALLDRAVFVLGRAILVAAPAGAIIWIMANVNVGDMSLLRHCSAFFEPFGKLIGLDGVVVMAFLLGFSANETVIPIMIMSYLADTKLSDFTGYPQLLSLLSANGWTVKTAVCMLILTILHFPCSTTCLTIKKETGSLKWTALSMLLPTAIGIALCMLVNVIF